MSDCGTRIYKNITADKINKILISMKNAGSEVNGNNPWDIDTHMQGIKLCGRWDEKTSDLSVQVTDSPWYLPCGMIWDKIDELMSSL